MNTELIVESTETIVGSNGGGATPTLDQSHSPVLPMATSGPKDLGKARGICFTIFGYEKIIDKLRTEAKLAEYAVLGFEVCPKSLRKHIQGYIYYENKRSLSKFSRDFGNCHVEPQRGKHREASDYCKKDKQFEEYGDLPVQGHRTDWEKAIKGLKDRTVEEIIEEQPQLAPCISALDKLKNRKLKPIQRDVKVIVLYGKGGTGKTRWAYDNYPDIYKKPHDNWWDGYEGQKAILLDDYYGYIKYSDLLTVLDRYPLYLNVKNSHVWAQYDTVVITSNKHPRFWYQGKWGWPLRRRLNRIIEVINIDGETRYEEEDFPASEEAWSET